MVSIIISDASSLILLEKISLLDILIKKFSFIIPKEVYDEAVTKGIEKNMADAYKIDEKVKEKVITIREVRDNKKTKEIIENFRVGNGEGAAVALFLEQKADILATDDRKAINVCNVYSIPFMTSLTFVLNAFENKLIKKQDAKDMIRQLDIYGRYKDELIYNALNKLKGIKNFVGD